MKNKTPKTSVDLSSELQSLLLELETRFGISQSAVIRQGIVAIYRQITGKNPSPTK